MRGSPEKDPVSIKWLFLTVLTTIIKYFSTIPIDYKKCQIKLRKAPQATKIIDEIEIWSDTRSQSIPLTD